MPFRAWKILKSLASLKIAIPLLVILMAATVVGSLFPQPELFRSWWYLGLLALLGLSLLIITILHIPRILRRKGRNALIGVIVTHAGILVLIGAAILGGLSASRWQLRAIESEMTVVPEMPFVLELVRLEIEDYKPSEFPGYDLSALPRKRQDSVIRLHRGGEQVAELTAAPGKPGRFEGFTLLPSVSDVGWVFEMLITDPLRREQTRVVRPWSPPVLQLGDTQVLAHPLMENGEQRVQLMTLQEGTPQVLRVLDSGEGIDIDGYRIRLGEFKRYTGVSVYNRPHMPLLIVGSLMMLAGLVWHFTHRYRD